MPSVVVSQVKEKCGTLRFIIRGFGQGGNAETHRLIALAQAQALRTCEECGQPAEMVEHRNYVRCTACASHQLNNTFFPGSD